MSINRMFAIGTAMAVVAILGLGWLYGVAPQLHVADTARSDRNAVVAENLEQESTLITLRNRSANLASLAGELTQLRRQIPATPDVEGFLDDLGAYAASSGVTLTTVTAGEALDYASTIDPALAAADAATPAADAANSDPVAGPASGAGVYTVAVVLTVSGSVEAIMDFTRAAQEGPRTFLATSVDLAAAEDDTLPSEQPEEETVSGGQAVADPGAEAGNALAVEDAADAEPQVGVADSAPASSGKITGYLFVVPGS